ncbi:MAG TPA: lipopolysaccharide biosynthesis protein [Stellaceae bacterium]|nr:lipopolysaccharide biosynthesis protein [Stellaceae bacterium]
MTPRRAGGALRRLVDRARAAAPRSRERYRRAAATFAAQLASQGVALLVLLASVPLALGYLGRERFGLWMTAVAAAELLSFASLGLDKGLLNALAAADGSGDRVAACRLVSTAFALVGAIVLALLALLALTYPVLPWARLLNVPASADAGPVMAVLIVAALLGLPASLVDTVQSAYQEGFRNGLWKAAGRVLSLAALAAAIALGGSVASVALAVAGAPLLAALANAVVLFGRRRPWLAPRRADVQRDTARRLFGSGSLFFLTQLALTIAYYADNLIVAQLAGSDAVAAYAVTARLFDLPGMLLLLIGAALWPPLAEAIARGDTAWAERGLRRLTIASLGLAAMTALPLMLLGPTLLGWWVGGAVAPPDQLFVAFGLFWLISALTQPMAVFLAAANALRLQLGCAALLAAGSLALKLLMAQRFGIAGVAWGRVAAEALLLLPYGLLLPRVMRRVRRGAAG